MTLDSQDPIVSFPARAGFTLLVLLMVTISCRVPSAQDDPDLVTSLHFTPSAFDSFRRNTELKYSLKTASTLGIYILRQDSSHSQSLVKTLVEGLTETKGAHSITWLGDSDQHLFVPTGMYFAMVRIGGRHFETIVEVFHF
jgi:hypothetical protein